ncbi:hypothetical protein [Nocardiopsis sp. CC223A]|uniref:hypothetical protein n=1 Tax=Nocardiopsis sp. CC223A TaxID=3044051 RepID=UPI0027957CB4|nr:hypothetical protein [Nocardiopsis sp. CC223A]
MPAVDALIDLLFPDGPPEPVGPPPAWPMPSDLREFFTRIGYDNVEVDNRFAFGIDRYFFQRSVYQQDVLWQVHESEVLAIRGTWVRTPGTPAYEGDWDVAVDDLLCFGSDDNGNQLYLEAVGDPDDWAVVVGGGGVGWARYTSGATAYLHGLLSGDLHCPAFTLEDWPEATLDVVVRHH